MGQVDGFLKFNRELPASRDPKERLGDYKEIYMDFPDEQTVKQAARCMDCGVPFCQSGCPLGNLIPEFNDAVYNEDWETAFSILRQTNNFPEFTGRICPAPCEGSCVLGINKPQITIEHIEKTIAEKAYASGFYEKQFTINRTGKRVAVIGSGPAGLATADQLNKKGHSVEVFERADRIGGLLRYGIPDFKLEKWVIDRRVKLMENQGVVFHTSANVGENVDPNELLRTYDALILAGGSTIPRDLPIEGRDLKGVHFAMNFLLRQNKLNAGDDAELVQPISAKGKNVVVIGGGDTGSDCVGTSNRHGAASVTQIELMPVPPASRTEMNPWPEWPMVLRTSSSHDEGCERKWSILTEKFIGNEKGELEALEICDIKWQKKDGRMQFEKIEGTSRKIDCDLAFLAMGFLFPQKEGMLEKLEIRLTERGNVKDDNFRTNLEKVFVAGDMRRGQSLVVHAIREGRDAAEAVCNFLES